MIMLMAFMFFFELSEDFILLPAMLVQIMQTTNAVIVIVFLRMVHLMPGLLFMRGALCVHVLMGGCTLYSDARTAITAGRFAPAGSVGLASRDIGSNLRPAPPQEVRGRTSTERYRFDLGQQQWDYEAAVGRQFFEPLLRPARDLRDLTGAAADSYKVDGTGQVYTFKLHPGARWSDGKLVKAGDFVYAFQRLLDPRLAAPYAAFYLT